VNGPDAAADDLSPRDFATVAELVRAHARTRPQQTALMQDGRTFDYAALDRRADRIAAALQRDQVSPRGSIAIAAATSIDYVAVFLGGLRAGVAVAPLPVSVDARILAAMTADAAAQILFLDRSTADSWADSGQPGPAHVIVMDDAGPSGLQHWMMALDSVPAAVDVQPDWPFNIIYSSGTTGVPKGIVQPHAFRWSNVQRARMTGYDLTSITLLATPLYSNTTLATLFGALAAGGTVVLMRKFAAADYLALAQQCRATHTVLVPVQYQRLLAEATFDAVDLQSFRMKFSTGAPFAPDLKQQVLRRWPGGLIEIYGMTEGGGACMLEAHAHPDKLHTVGRPLPRNELRLIDAADREVSCGTSGEIVGRSPAMMTGYLNQPLKTQEAEWHDAAGRRFIRSGDIGCLDADGFLVLLDRKKDMIISGGFNVYPSDLEAVLRGHPAVEEAAVVGLASARWGETPVACVVLKAGAELDAAHLTAWANARLGKTQRIDSVKIMSRLPRNGAGKVLKGELRDAFS
jgi:long-chain acyl-CoA synthetase